ncbi:MAG: hypothetical protein RLY93_01820 [Sumerlaeia bacterium]
MKRKQWLIPLILAGFSQPLGAQQLGVSTAEIERVGVGRHSSKTFRL